MIVIGNRKIGCKSHNGVFHFILNIYFELKNYVLLCDFIFTTAKFTKHFNFNRLAFQL